MLTAQHRTALPRREQRTANASDPREWSLTSLAQNRPTFDQIFCLSKVKQCSQKN